MKIIVDAAGKKEIEDLCDLALRVGGLQNNNAVDAVLHSMEDLPEKPPEKEIDDG